MYFELYWIDKDRQRRGGLIVDLTGQDAADPGKRVRELTLAAQEMSVPGLRLRTELYHELPADAEGATPLRDYLWGDGNFNKARLQRHLERAARGQRPHVYQIRPGTYVSGENLVARGAVVMQIEGLLKSSSCHLRAPRRYGKTSILRRLFDRVQPSIFLDVCDVSSALGFLDKVLEAGMARRETESALRALPELAAWPPADAEEAVRRAALAELVGERRERLLSTARRVLHSLADAGVVLLIDEFSIFLRAGLEEDENETEVREFLALARDLRTHASPPLRCVLAGSAGLSAYVEFLHLSEALADLTGVDLPPLTREDGAMLAEELLYGAGKAPTPQVVDRILAHLGPPVPYFIHALVHETVAQCQERKTPSPEDVDVAYHDRLLGSPGNYFFRDFLLRERQYPPPLRKGASAILRVLAHAAEPVPESTLWQRFLSAVENGDESDFARLMTCLQEDYDLARSDAGAWRMNCKVLADRWRRGEPWLTETR